EKYNEINKVEPMNRALKELNAQTWFAGLRREQSGSRATLPVLSVEATNWSLGKKDGYQQRSKSASFPQGTSWHDVQLDNQQ
ncbi:phosphoadenosine phosphosulfate reductase domain-containing protein, partial [Klebsiella pneumoniae]|uniref:phosphoadenosine phosphosulfate reductase domain-containing protein n=1 Tax=Klebsiella pneumoniae TaxID=573 RepID=UPI003EDFE3F4